MQLIPRVRTYLHAARDSHALAEDLVQRSRAHRVPERGLGEQPGRVVGILDIGHTDCRIGDTVINYGIHGHGHAILGQHLKCKTQSSGSAINSPSKPTIARLLNWTP